MKIKGVIGIGEASAWTAQAMAPLSGHPWPQLISTGVTLGLMLPIAFLSIGAQSILGLPWWVGLLGVGVGAWIAGQVGARACRAWAVRRFRKALHERDLIDPVNNSIELTPESFVYSSARVAMNVPWPAVSDVRAVGPYWVVLADSWPIFIPRRYFPANDGERAFIETMLEHMGPEARARSAEALKVVT